MDAPSPAACAIVLREPNEERTSQVSILGKAEFLASRAGRIRCVSPQPFESVALPGATGEVHRGGLRQFALLGPREARPRGQVVAAASNPSSSVNDAADADAEAASRPTMRFVAVKTEEQQLHGMAGTKPGGSGRRFAVASSALWLRKALPTSGSLRCWRLPSYPVHRGRPTATGV